MYRRIVARVAFPAGEIGVTGLYVPSRGPKDRRNQDKRAFQEVVAAVLPHVQQALDVSGPVVVTGDLNVLEPDHDPRHAVFGEWEYDFYRAFGQAGFDDAFRIKEPVRMDYSWFGRPSADGKRNGYRFDHAFVSRAHRAAVVECRYDHSVRTAGLTDHSALSLTLDLADLVVATGSPSGVAAATERPGTPGTTCAAIVHVANSTPPTFAVRGDVGNVEFVTHQPLPATCT